MKLTLLLLLSLLAKPALSQNLTGLWQAGDTLVSSAYRAHYIFGPGSKFAYHPDEYDGLQRIITIAGRYVLKGTTLYLTADYTTEKIGGSVARSHINTLNDTWEIEGGRQIIRKNSRPLRQPVKFQLVKRKKGLCMLLDSQPYYKIRPQAN